MLAGSQEVRPKGAQTLPTRSWIMTRPTRVPASTVVRMKSASNMIAKWYQKACSPAPRKAVTWAKIAAIPTARVGAPPVRPTMDSSPTASAAPPHHALAPLLTSPPPCKIPHRLNFWDGGYGTHQARAVGSGHEAAAA